MAADFLIASSVGLFALAMLDILLSDGQKRRVNDASIKIWYLIDQARRLSFLNALRRKNVRLGVSLLVLLISCVPFFILFKEQKEFIVDYLIACMIFIIVGPKMLEFVIRESTPFRIATKAVLVTILFSIASAGSVVGIDYITSRNNEGAGGGYFSLPSNFGTVVAAFFAAIFFMISLLSLIFLPLIIAILAMPFLASAEYVVRRIAEYPKGPILAASALLGAATAVVKSMV